MPLRTAKVLIADDDANQRWLLGKAFEKVFPGSQPQFVRDGREVIEYLETTQSPPDLLLLDHRMTRVDAFGVLKWLRETPGFAAMPVVIMSFLDLPMDRERALQMGAQEYLAKPTGFTEMKQFIENLGCYLKGTLK